MNRSDRAGHLRARAAESSVASSVDRDVVVPHDRLIRGPERDSGFVDQKNPFHLSDRLCKLWHQVVAQVVQLLQSSVLLVRWAQPGIEPLTSLTLEPATEPCHHLQNLNAMLARSYHLRGGEQRDTDAVIGRQQRQIGYLEQAPADSPNSDSKRPNFSSTAAVSSGEL